MQKNEKLTYQGDDVVGDIYCNLLATGEKNVHVYINPNSMDIFVEYEPDRYTEAMDKQSFYDLRPELDGKPLFLDLWEDSYNHHEEDYNQFRTEDVKDSIPNSYNFPEERKTTVIAFEIKSEGSLYSKEDVGYYINKMKNNFDSIKNDGLVFRIDNERFDVNEKNYEKILNYIDSDKNISSKMENYVYEEGYVANFIETKNEDETETISSTNFGEAKEPLEGELERENLKSDEKPQAFDDEDFEEKSNEENEKAKRENEDSYDDYNDFYDDIE